MPINRSRAFTSRIILLVVSGVLFALVSWVGFRLFQPTDLPPTLPPQSPVSFNADKAIESNSAFEKLKQFVQGGYIVGTVGNSYPLGGDPKKKVLKGYDSKSLLATAKEIELNGLFVKSISLQSSGGILVLLSNKTSDGLVHYEIRSMGLKEEKTISQWNAQDQSELRVSGLAQDSTGKIWLLNEKGRIGVINTDGSPAWLLDLSTGLVASNPEKFAISIDALDRVWISDGAVVSMGGERGFTPLDLIGELTADQRTQYETILSSQAEQIGLQSVSSQDVLLRFALAPKKFYPLSDGRMGLTTAFGAMIFPQSQSSRSEWIPTLKFNQIPYGISEGGTVWGIRYTDRVFTRIVKEKEVLFSSGPTPSAEGLKSSMVTFLDEGVFVFEQLEKMTNLWYSEGDAWSTKLVSTTGTQSIIAQPVKIEAEASGVLWSLTSDGHLYEITSGAVVESPTNGMNI